MFGKKKISGSDEIRLGRDEFCKVLDMKAEDYTHKFCIDTDAEQYNLLYQNGRFMGMPTPFGGSIYPFAIDPTKQGSKHDKKKFNRARIVCLSKKYNIVINWGTRTPFMMIDKATQKPYTVGAKGVFYLQIDPTDAARSGDNFYRSCVTQSGDTYNEDELKAFLSAAFVNRVGGKIQEYLEKLDRPLSNLVGLQPSEMVKISEELYPQLKDIFAEYGLIMVESSSSGAILNGLIVTPKEI